MTSKDPCRIYAPQKMGAILAIAQRFVSLAIGSHKVSRNNGDEGAGCEYGGAWRQKIR